MADQIWTIIKKVWISDLGILDVHLEINMKSCQQQQPNTRINKLNTEKQEPISRTKLQSCNNRNIQHCNQAKQRLTQEDQKINIDIIKNFFYWLLLFYFQIYYRKINLHTYKIVNIKRISFI